MGHQFDFGNGPSRLKVLLVFIQLLGSKSLLFWGKEGCLACVDKSRMCQNKGANMFKISVLKALKRSVCSAAYKDFHCYKLGGNLRAACKYYEEH